jgi:hypothetical protein
MEYLRKDFGLIGEGARTGIILTAIACGMDADPLLLTFLGRSPLARKITKLGITAAFHSTKAIDDKEGDVNLIIEVIKLKPGATNQRSLDAWAKEADVEYDYDLITAWYRMFFNRYEEFWRNRQAGGWKLVGGPIDRWPTSFYAFCTSEDDLCE